MIAAALLLGAAFTVNDVHRLADISEPVFAPDGRTIAYVLSTHNRADDATVSDIWSVAPAGGKPRHLTKTPGISEWSPRVAGARLTFLSDGTADETTQLFSMPAKGGRARQITRIAGGISDYALAPDGRRAVIVAKVGPRVGEDPKRPSPIVIDRFLARDDERGWLDARQHLFLVDMATGKTVALTHGEADHWLPSWSPDGRHIAYVALAGAEADRTLDYEVYLVAAEPGATARNVSNFRGADLDPYWDSRPEWSADSRHLVWLRSAEDKWIYYAPSQIVVADLASGDTRSVANIDRAMTRPRFAADGSIVALVEQDRTTRLARIDPAGGAIAYLTADTRFAHDFALSATMVAVLDGDPRTPYVLRDASTGAVIADHNDWLRERTLAETRDVSWTSADGARVYGLLVLPPGRPARTLPLIVRLHGGPVYQWSREFMADWQVFAAAGYAVLGVNPRGSSGRGFDFARAIYADWGNLDVADVSAGIDWAIGAGIADPGRIGVGGWSYGGILANYMIASDTRIGAAVSGAGLSNVLAAYGHDQYAREYELELGTPWDDFESYARLSYPFLQAGRIETPTLFLCAGADENVPCIGAEQMYQALRSRRVPTQLVVYPGEDHGLVRPRFIADRLRRSLDWYDRFLRADDKVNR
jgi:dipeptidyl aminopeptidase/acylaminoacyl peptidase